MAPSQSQGKKLYPRALGNLALSQVTLEALRMPNSKAEDDRSRVVGDERQEELDDDPLGVSRGIVNGLRLSVTLWSFIALVVLLMW